MRHHLHHIIAAVLALTALTARADYPVFYQRFTADPWAIEYEGRLYVYCSHDFYDASRGYGYFMRDITLISTDDMKNWTDHGEVFSVDEAAWHPSFTWAPCVVERDGTFYLYYGNGGSGISVATADNPLGPFRDTRPGPMVDFNTPGVILRDSLGNVVKNDLTVWGALHDKDRGFWCFDPGVFIDDDGQAYMCFGGAHPNNARIIKLKSDLVEVDGEAVNPHIPGFFEASAMHKHAGRYYYSYSGLLWGKPCNTEYVIGSSPMGPFSFPYRAQENPPLNDGRNNHQCIFDFQGQSYIAYHNRALAYMLNKPDNKSREYMRNVAIDRLEYNPDGTIKPVEMTRDGLRQLHPVDPFKRNEAETMAKGWVVQTQPISAGSKNRVVSEINDGDYIVVKGVDFKQGARSFEASVACSGKGGVIEVRLESERGILLCSLPVADTGGWDKWQTLSAKTQKQGGVADLYLVFRSKGKPGSEVCRMDWWKFD